MTVPASVDSPTANANRDAETVNVASRLSIMATQRPDQVAIAVPNGRDDQGKRIYHTVTFAELERDTNRIASGLTAAGVKPGMRLVLMVRPGIDFITLVFALLKSGAVAVLIDPGIGRRNLIRCLSEANPDGFVAIPIVHAMRTLLLTRFRKANFNVTVGKRWFWGGPTIAQIRQQGTDDRFCATTAAADPAAIIFTSGSTGPPKGVLYHHDIFDQQVIQIQQQYDIQPGEIDLPAFPLFGLFNAAMGVTTVIPDMDFTQPARANPIEIVEAIRDWKVTQSFGSPAFWNTVSRHCEADGIRLPTLRRVLSAGAPVPPSVLSRVQESIADDGQVHTPYGATESLPVATISAAQVLGNAPARETGHAGTISTSNAGGGTCVGKRFPGIAWRIIRISDDPIDRIDQVDELPRGEIGELIVQGRVVTREYVTRTEANRFHKISDADNFWHRMGDVGYLDEQDRFWFCGRKSHRVVTSEKTMFTIPCEAMFNQHAAVFRSALVGVGAKGSQTPVMLVELEKQQPRLSSPAKEELRKQLLQLATAHEHTSPIKHVLIHPFFPVDIRHNAKIFREKLSIWASRRIRLNG